MRITLLATNVLKYAAIVIGLIFLSQIIYLGYLACPVADDYCNINLLREKGSWQKIVWAYFYWSGRVLAVLLRCILARSMDFLPWLSAALGATLIALAYLIYRILAHILKTELNLTDTTLMVILFAISFWSGLKPIAGDAVYWATGGLVYVLIASLMLLWLLIFLRLMESTNKKSGFLYKLMLFLFSFLIGTGNQGASSALLFLALAILSLVYFNKQNIRTEAIVACTGLALGVIIMLTAPGNFVRANYGTHSFETDIFTILINYKQILNSYLNVSRATTIYMLIPAFVLPVITKLHIRHEKQGIGMPSLLYLDHRIRVFFFLFAGAALIAVAPLGLVPGFASSRNALFFILFVILSEILLLSKFLYSEGNYNENSRGNSHSTIMSSILAIIVIVMVVLKLPFINEETEKAKNIKSQFEMRTQYIISQKQKGLHHLTVSAISGERPAYLHFNDITSDPDHWINQCVAKYYGLESIQLE